MDSTFDTLTKEQQDALLDRSQRENPSAKRKDITKALRRYGPIEIDSLLEVVGMPREAGKD